ncbi:MAG: hypothetical protein ACM3U2_01820 [Deltaproteobacteria bacterium]
MLRFVLMLSLWHAPIPWVHAHQIEGPQVEHLQLLSQHVAEFHARELSQGEETLDWHVHLVLPWCLVHHFPCPDKEQRDPGSDDYFGGARLNVAGMNSAKMIGQPTARGFLARTPASDHPAVLADVIGARAALSALGRGTHFFETYGRPHSVRDLVGVRIC